MNPVAYINSADIMPWIGNEYYYSKAFAEPTKADYQATAVGNKIYSKAQAGWSSWLTLAGFRAGE